MQLSLPNLTHVILDKTQGASRTQSTKHKPKQTRKKQCSNLLMTLRAIWHARAHGLSKQMKGIIRGSKKRAFSVCFILLDIHVQ